MRLLSEKFSIQQAARTNLRSWLAVSMRFESLSQLCHLLALGADPPPLDEQFNHCFFENSSDGKGHNHYVTPTLCTLKSLRSKFPELITVIEQAHEGGQDIEIPNEQSWVGSKGPLVNIVLSQGKFEIAKKVIKYRSIAVMVVVSLIALKILPWGLAIWCSGLAAWNYYNFECQRAKKHLREKALDVFKRVFPVHSVVSFAAQDLPLVQKLSKKDLVKFDDHGYILWDHFESLQSPNFEIFKLFADAVADKEPAFKEKFFCSVVRSGHAKFVKYLLENHKIKIEEISDQFTLWLHLNDVSVARVLKSFGFDPEVRDENDMTPLHLSLNNDRYPNVKRIRALLVAGAKCNPLKVPNFNQLSSDVKSLCSGTSYIEKIYQAIF
jgi:hypothetical protein